MPHSFVFSCLWGFTPLWQSVGRYRWRWVKNCTSRNSGGAACGFRGSRMPYIMLSLTSDKNWKNNHRDKKSGIFHTEAALTEWDNSATGHCDAKTDPAKKKGKRLIAHFIFKKKIKIGNARFRLLVYTLKWNGDCIRDKRSVVLYLPLISHGRVRNTSTS